MLSSCFSFLLNFISILSIDLYLYIAKSQKQKHLKTLPTQSRSRPFALTDVKRPSIATSAALGDSGEGKKKTNGLLRVRNLRQNGALCGRPSASAGWGWRRKREDKQSINTERSGDSNWTSQTLNITGIRTLMHPSVRWESTERLR